MRVQMFITILAIMSFNPVFALQPKESWVPSKEIVKQIPEWMQQAGVPGSSIAVVEGNQIVWRQHFGIANVEENLSVSDRTYFEAASMSKPVFAYLVMMLVEAGQVELDRPLVQYYRPDYLADHPWIDKVTVRDALRHTTGLPNWGGRDMPKITPVSAPGEKFSYSGEAYVWLQTAISRLTGHRLEVLAKRFLFEPLGMKHSTFSWHREAQEHAAFGYLAPNEDNGIRRGFQFKREFVGRMLDIADKWQKPLYSWGLNDELASHPLVKHDPLTNQAIRSAPIESYALRMNYTQNSAGGLTTTAADYAKFLALMMSDKSTHKWALSDFRRNDMLRYQTSINDKGTIQGIGWRYESTPAGKVFFHGGNNGNIYKSFSVGHLDSGRALVIFTNSGAGDVFYKHIVERFTGLRLADHDRIADLAPTLPSGNTLTFYPQDIWEEW